MQRLLLFLVALVGGCDARPISDESAQVYERAARLHITSLQIPRYGAEFALDLNGDGRGDDQIGNILDAVAGAPAFAPTAAQIDLDPDQSAVELVLPLAPGIEALRLPLVGVRLSTAPSATGVVEGRLGGALIASDIERVLIPALARALTQIVAAHPDGDEALRLLAFFDTLPACGAAGDGQIDACELGTHPFFRQVLAPDVQLFADDGVTYRPNPGNTHKDSLSVGVGFVARFEP